MKDFEMISKQSERCKVMMDNQIQSHRFKIMHLYLFPNFLDIIGSLQENSDLSSEVINKIPSKWHSIAIFSGIKQIPAFHPIQNKSKLHCNGLNYSAHIFFSSRFHTNCCHKKLPPKSMCIVLICLKVQYRHKQYHQVIKTKMLQV